MFGSSDFRDKSSSSFLKISKLPSFYTSNLKIFTNALGQFIQIALPNLWLLVLIEMPELTEIFRYSYYVIVLKSGSHLSREIVLFAGNVEKYFLFHLKNFFRFQDIYIFVLNFKRAFKVKQKTFFIISKELSVAKTGLRPKSAPLSHFGYMTVSTYFE